MKNKKSISLFVVVSICIGLLSGCTTEQTSASVGSAPSSSTPSSSVPAGSSTPSSSQPSSSAPSSSSKQESSSQKPEESSSAPASSAVQPPENGGDQLTKLETGNADFDQAFSKNPIDPNYLKEINEALSTVDMITVTNKYVDIWKTEVTYLHNLLIRDYPKEKDKYEKEQNEWLAGEEAAFAKIDAAAAAVGGTLAKVDEASERMEYYRAREIELLKEYYLKNSDLPLPYSINAS